VADWYDGWVGKDGSDHHRNLAIPAVLDLLQAQNGEHLLDIGAGQGVLAPYITKSGAKYTGIDVSPNLLEIARKRHGKHGQFLQGDARRLATVRGISGGTFDAVIFLLSIEDIDPLADALDSAAWALRDGGRVVILMRHPCFRVPRQSGWGYDENRQLQYRRIDSYLSPLSVPMKSYTGGPKGGVTISFHRPLSQYINELAVSGLLVDTMREITTFKPGQTSAEQRANQEFPLFLAMRARKFRTELP
jgi:SAM-dependent methyltransferase